MFYNNTEVGEDPALENESSPSLNKETRNRDSDGLKVPDYLRYSISTDSIYNAGPRGVGCQLKQFDEDHQCCPCCRSEDEHLPSCCTCCLTSSSCSCCITALKEENQASVILILLLVGAMGLYLWDVTSDIQLAIDYYTKYISGGNMQYRHWARLTLSLIIGPNIVETIISAWFFVSYNAHDYKGTSGDVIVANHNSGHQALSTNSSTRKIRQDPDRKKKWMLFIVTHFLLQGALFRMVDTLYLAVLSRWRHKKEKERGIAKTFWRMTKGERITKTIALVEVYFESLPQLFLQLYIFTRFTQNVSSWKAIYIGDCSADPCHAEISMGRNTTQPIQCYSKSGDIYELCIEWHFPSSIASSWLSVAAALPSFLKASRDEDHINRGPVPGMGVLSMVAMVLWRLMTTCSRVLAMVAWTSVFHLYILLFAGIHWLAMALFTVLFLHKVGEKGFQGYIKNSIASFVMIFDYFHPIFVNRLTPDWPTRLRITLYYTIIFVENSALVVSWYYHTQDEDLVYRQVVLVAVFATFILGMIFLVLYYAACHPRHDCPKHRIEICRENWTNKFDGSDQSPWQL